MLQLAYLYFFFFFLLLNRIFILLAIFCSVFWAVSAEKELSIEELHPDHGEDEQEQNVDDEDVEDVLQRDHNAVKHSLECGNAVHHLQRAQHAEQLHRLQFLACWSSPKVQGNVLTS